MFEGDFISKKKLRKYLFRFYKTTPNHS